MRFSLRWMLIGVAFIAVPLGIWVNRAREQTRAVTEIRRFGGDVEYASSPFPLVQSVAGIDFAASGETVRLVRHGPGFYDTGLVTDLEGLVLCLRRFSSLKEVVLMDFNHREWKSKLEALFPKVKIVVAFGGII